MVTQIDRNVINEPSSPLGEKRTYHRRTLQLLQERMRRATVTFATANPAGAFAPAPAVRFQATVAPGPSSPIAGDDL